MAYPGSLGQRSYFTQIKAAIQRRLKSFKRHDLFGACHSRTCWKISPILAVLFVVCYLSVFRNVHVVQMVVSKNIPKMFLQSYKPEMQYDVILNSYMRSGSSILGKLLGFRNDTFYFYEPLWMRHKWEYIKGQSQLCSYVAKNCSEIGDSLEYSQKFIHKMFDCDYLDYSDNFDAKLHALWSGAKWEQYRPCRIEENLTARECLSRFSYMCPESKHRFSKLLRMTLDNLIPIMRQRPNLKVVHLWRDPRGILNSHWRSKWYPMYQESIEVMQEDAEQTCERMFYDFKVGQTMYNEFPDRFRFIQYEEFANVSEKTRLLSEFLGWTFTEEDSQIVQLLASSAKSQMDKIMNAKIPKFEFNPSSWRTSFPWEYIQAIDAVCADVYRVLGYTRFTTAEDCVNLELPAFADPLPYTLTV